MDEIRSHFVDHVDYASSDTRLQVFEDWLQAKAMIDQLSPDLIEAAWIGGSFVTNRRDPDDMDSLFLINQEAFEALPSNTARTKVMAFNKKGRLREKTGLRVEAFVLVRQPHANPWQGGGVAASCQEDFALRGAWDDWWLRVRLGGKDDPPTIEEAEPVRGYLEVLWQ
ncbi:hypothetical protein AAIG35_04200 [Cellulosimicrobium funkei]